jgi:hypothetical protein
LTLKYRGALAVVSCFALLHAVPAAAATGPVWQPVAKIAGVFDLGGPRADGWLVAAGAARLYLVDPLGAVTPFAQGPDGYADDKGGEAYLTVVPKLPAAATGSSAGCSFQPGDVYILRLHAPLGLTKVDVHGVRSDFTPIPNVSSLNGITFDAVGTFGYRLVVTGAVPGSKTEVAAVDCAGKVSVITRTAPVMEGGIEVAPQSFGSFGGKLIAPDELSGNIYAVGADGASQKVAASGLPRGGDIGVETVGFVPPGWNGSVFYSDRVTAGNPHPGSDNVIVLSSGSLTAVGVKDGDLLGVTEGGATLIDVRCATSCTVTKLITVATRAHGEGHLAFTNAAPVSYSRTPPSATPAAASSSGGGPDLFVVGVIIVALVVLVVAAVLVLLDLRGRAQRPGPPA